jgi:hypothetical protein
VEAFAKDLKPHQVRGWSSPLATRAPPRTACRPAQPGRRPARRSARPVPRLHSTRAEPHASDLVRSSHFSFGHLTSRHTTSRHLITPRHTSLHATPRHDTSYLMLYCTSLRGTDQVATLPSGGTVLDRAVVQHNLAAASRLYSNIGTDQV